MPAESECFARLVALDADVARLAEGKRLQGSKRAAREARELDGLRLLLAQARAPIQDAAYAQMARKYQERRRGKR